MDKLDALGDSRLRSALLFARARPRGVTADDVARGLAIPRSAARWRLEKLVDSGLLEFAFERRTGRSGPGAGRPAKTYRPAAETTAIEFPHRRYESLVGLLAQIVPRRRRDHQLGEVGIAYAKELAAAMRLRPAATLPMALERVCRGLGRLGFHAAVDAASNDHGVLATATCPLRPLIVGHPEARAIDEGMWRELITLAAADGRRLSVSCSTHDCLATDKSCRVVVAVDRRD